MADKSSSVRVLQQHLRQAGECLGAGDFEGANGHVDAALVVDPSSLAALSLRDRISRMRSMQSNPGVDPRERQDVADGAMARPAMPAGRFVPKGVDPNSWMSFEGRIEERRFQSLLRSAHEAMARGDVLAARLAVEEARELRPDSPEVAAVGEAIATLPVAARAPDSGSFVQSRTFRAAGTLVFGVTLMLALDWLRSDPPQSVPLETAAVGRGAGAREPDILASVSRGQTEASVLDRLPAGAADPAASAPPLVTPPTTAASAPRVATTDTAASPTAPRSNDELAGARTTDAQSVRPAALPAGEVPDDFVVTSRVTAQAVVTSRAAPPPLRGEIPDNYVAVPPVTNRSTVLAPTPSPPAAVEASVASRESAGGGASGALPLGNVVRESSPAASLATGARGVGSPTGDTPAAAGASAAIPRDDRSQVMTVVDNYARAFERLDARAARAVWPTVDERALGRAFNEIESQDINFAGPCDVDVQGARATASCRGTARYVVKVGNREPRTEPRTWDIRLSRSGDEWFIDSVRVASR